MDIRKIIEQELQKHGEVRAAKIIRKSGLSRAYVNRIFQQLRHEGKIRLIGKANRARYVESAAEHLNRVLEQELFYQRILVNKEVEEDRILDQMKYETGIFLHIPEHIRKMVEYGFTEMLNNAIEHSQSARIAIRVQRTSDGIWFIVTDYGIGIFNKIMQTRNLGSEKAAIQDLLKGKQTTSPELHRGEGIFFTSRTADKFEIKSSDKKILFDNQIGDIFIGNTKKRKGTEIYYWLTMESQRTLQAIFQQYGEADYSFDKTEVVVKLYLMDSGFVSRSQARRLLVGLEKFRTIVLDFQDVQLVGQGFADEIFRVWKSRHPEIKIEVINANPNAQLMIQHVMRAN